MRKLLGVDVTSSVDPNSISLSIKAVGVAVIPVILLIARGFGFDFAEADLTAVINALATVAAGVMFIIGMTRKYYTKFKK